MGRKTVALNLDEEVYAEYQKYCKDNHMILSRKVEALMKKELEDLKSWTRRKTRDSWRSFEGVDNKCDDS